MKIKIVLFFLCLFVSNAFSQEVYELERYKHLDTSAYTAYLSNIPYNDSTALNNHIDFVFKKFKKEKPGLFFILNNISYNLIKKAEYTKAKYIIDKTQLLAKENKDTSFYEFGYSLFLQSYIGYLKRDYHQWNHYVDKTVKFYEKNSSNDTLICFWYTKHIASSFASRNIRDGFYYFDRCIELSKKIHMPEYRYNAYLNAGNILNFYEPKVAVKFLEQALYIGQTEYQTDPIDYVYLTLITGSSYMAQDKFEQAKQYFESSLDTLEFYNLNHPFFKSVLKGYSGSVQKQLGNYQEAIAVLKNNFEEIGKYKTNAIFDIGESYFKIGQYDSALVYLNKAYTSFKQNYGEQNILKTLKALSLIADTYFQSGKNDTAIQLSRRTIYLALNHPDTNKNEIIPEINLPDNASYNLMGDFIMVYIKALQKDYLKTKRTNPQDILKCYQFVQKAISNKSYLKTDRESQRTFSKIARKYSFEMMSFFTSVPDLPAEILYGVWELASISKTHLLNVEMSKQETHYNLDDSEQKKYEDLKLKINQNLTGTKENNIELLEAYKDLFLLTFDKTIDSIYDGFNLNIDIENILKNIKPNSIVYDYHIQNEKLFIFIKNQNTLELIEKKSNSDYLGIIYNTIREVKMGAENIEAIKEVSELLLPGLEALEQDVQSIQFIPDKELLLFPFEILSYRGDYLIKNASVSYLYTLKQLDKEKKQMEYNHKFCAFAPIFEDNSNQMLAYRNFDYETIQDSSVYRSDKLIPLPNTEIECDMISTIFKKKNFQTDYYIAANASVKNLKTCLANSEITHIASHGVSDKETSKTGIFMLEGENIEFLSLDSIYNLKIGSQLVVLSACKTATGQIINSEGIMSLPRGFILADVPNVMASLWKVHDEKTKDFMVFFYTQLIQRNISYSEALRLAKIEFIDMGYLPIDWAGFILIGNN